MKCYGGGSKLYHNGRHDYIAGMTFKFCKNCGKISGKNEYYGIRCDMD